MTQNTQNAGDAQPMMNLIVARKVTVADSIVQFDLKHADNARLPDFSAGAHITVLTPNGLTRRYSLCNDPADKNVYSIAVKRDAQGMGGSKNLVDVVREGDVLPTSHPVNYFPLDKHAKSHLLVAGGIGITPILSMIRELQHQQADFKVIYLTRDSASAAFLDELAAPDLKERVLVHHTQQLNLEQTNSQPFNLSHLMAQQPEEGHVYCCGPRRLMQAVKEYAQHWPAQAVHFEDFGTSEQPGAAEDRPFAIRLSRTGRTIQVPRGVSILEALRREKISVPSSCESGTCGSCRTRLLSGTADHRDYVLDSDEHNDVIMICVSRAVSPVLEIDA